MTLPFKLVAFLNKYPDRIVTIEGYTDSVGKSDPVAGNDSATDRQQNRRVAVIIETPSSALG